VLGKSAARQKGDGCDAWSSRSSFWGFLTSPCWPYM